MGHPMHSGKQCVRYVSYDVMIRWPMGVLRAGTERGSKEYSKAEERGGAVRCEPRRAVFFGLTIAHAHRGISAVLAVQLP